MSGGDFLARWSKRKRAVARPAPPATEPSDAAAGTETPGQVADGEIRGLDGEEAGLLSPEELAKLPSLESLTSETDLTQFLRAGVPMLMRKAALRRMWSLDTNIRDYVGEAREYAYDWNAIGGVPGNGPMLPTDDIKAMLRDIFDGTPVAEVEPEPPPGEPEADEARAGGVEADAAETSEIVQTDSGSPMGEEAADAPRSEPRQLPASTGEGTLPPSLEAAPAARARRHGGAVPL